jgi:hypothetical protein
VTDKVRGYSCFVHPAALEMNTKGITDHHQVLIIKAIKLKIEQL